VLEAVREAADVIPILLGEGDQKAMNVLHARGVTPKPYRKPSGEEEVED
jgi:hypothetical protein